MPGHRPHRHRLSLLCITAVLAFASLPLQANPRISVYAAASLTDAMGAVIQAYEASHPVDLVPVYASSSTLARQIDNGAPADIYLSANEQWMDWLAQRGIALSQRADLLQNRLALIAPGTSPIEPFAIGDTTPIATYLQPGERLSVGDPDHVPAGIYARQALEHLGEWDALQDRLARGDNVRAALALVERGETPLGIVYQTDAQASQVVRLIGLFPEDSHPAITYPVALIGASPSDAARAFRDWLMQPAARDIFTRCGFSPSPAAR